MAELEESQPRPYYDAEADQADADHYHRGTTFDELTRLLTDTHRNQSRYQPAKELYPWIDLQPDRKIRSLYTGHTYEPAELIAEDFRIAERRAERLRTFPKETALGEVEAELERELPYNWNMSCRRELVQQEGTDARRPASPVRLRIRCNSFRGNTP